MAHKILKFITCILLFASFTACMNNTGNTDPVYRLWYEQPADRWEETLPLGNGRIGMMPDGGIFQEKLVLNEISLWSGGPEDPNNPDAAPYLPIIQQLLFEGRNDEAQEMVYRTFVCQGAGSGHGNGSNVPYGSYELLGNLIINHHDDTTQVANGYYRELNIENATASTRFEMGGTRYAREYLTSFTDDIGIIRYTASGKGKINMSMELARPRAFKTSVEDNTLIMEGQLNNGTDGNGMRYIARVKPLLKGGSLSSDETSLTIIDADEVVVLISMATDYRHQDFRKAADDLLRKAAEKSYISLRKEHIAAYQKYFNRVNLQLVNNPEREFLPTDKRLLAFAGDGNDNGLVNLYFQYGRYLLISSAHAQVLPPNLQGLWAHTIRTPWNGDYHLNINVQMNHWPAEITNLAELHKPLVELTKSLVEPGTQTARVFYNASGWVAHMMTNIWGFTAPGEHPSWGATNTGGAWLTAHLWEHYDYSRDEEYLKEIYPVLRGASEFFLDMLVTDPATGWLVTAPTTSPENAFIMPGTRKPVYICMGSTMDNQIIRELFRNTMEAASILKVDGEFTAHLQEASRKLPPNRIGSDGRLMEWLEEYEEAEPQHRHVSHLYGLHPGNEITPEFTPDLAEAAKQTLYTRGDGGTGWSRAWKINFWARLQDGNHAFRLVRNLMEPVFDTGFNYSNKGGTYPNMFCAHPPFQIDGNFGGTAGIAEMFVQSHAGFIHFIPALPDEFSEGSFTGLRVRGEGVVSAVWKDKQLTTGTLHAGRSDVYTIRIPAYAKNIEVRINGKVQSISPDNGMLNARLNAGETLTLHIR